MSRLLLLLVFVLWVGGSLGTTARPPDVLVPAGFGAVGVGAVVGSLTASLLVGTARLGAWFAVGVALWGLPITLVGALPQEVPALCLLAFAPLERAPAWADRFRAAARRRRGPLTPEPVRSPGGG